jgi:hypothetical protein
MEYGVFYKLIVTQLFNKFPPFMEREGTLLCSYDRGT